MVVVAVLVVAGSGFLAARALSSGAGEARRAEPARGAMIVGSAGDRLQIGAAVTKIPDSQRPTTGEPLKVSDLLLVAGINVPIEPQGRSLVLAALSSSEWTLIDADTGDELGVVPASRDVVVVAVLVESSHQRFEIVSGNQRSGPLQVSIA